MNTKWIISLLEDQLRLSADREKEHLEREKNHLEQIEKLTLQLDRLTQTIESLEKALLEKNSRMESLQARNQTIGKLIANKSEKIKPEVSISQVPLKKDLKERGNNAAKRKDHYRLETIIEEIEPEVPDFNKDKALLVGHVDCIRYQYVPPRFIKHIYRQLTYQYKDQLVRGKAPAAPLFNSNYDASFIAGLLQIRYIYSLPVERILKLFAEYGFELNKATAHNLIKGACALLDNMGKALHQTIQQDTYLSIDETYHNVLEKGKNKEGKKISKGYLWAALAREKKLIQYFYQNGSRTQGVLTGYIEGYRGAIQSDGLNNYKILETEAYPGIIRIGCIQHAKRKFLDVEADPKAKEIVELINTLYHIEHSFNEYTPAEQKLLVRQKEAPPILHQIKKKSQAIIDDPSNNPKGSLFKAARYLLNEYDALYNYIRDPRYKLDNNDLERCMRYISLSRRNSLFAGSHKGAERSALIYSLAISCRLNNINSFEYFKDLLTQMPAISPNATISTFIKLLPNNWKKK